MKGSVCAIYDEDTVLSLVKVRLNRLSADISLDDYLKSRIEAAASEIERMGITLTDSTEDAVLLTDYTVYQYGARDQQTGMPDWLRYRIHVRWIGEGQDDTDDS